MPSTKHAYVLADAAPAAEVRRLQQIDGLMAPVTQGRLERLGIGPGWACLEVGAGVGGVARWMAERVGPSGRVTAIDLNPLFEADPTLPQLEIRRHNILAEGLDDASYDLAHCRLLLCNVGDVERALGNMVRALRPGGWLIVEEPGDTRFPAVGEANPNVAEFHRLAGAFLQAVHEHAKSVAIDLFRRLPLLFEHAGLTAIGGDLSYPLVNQEGRAALLGTLHAMRPVLANAPFVRDGDLDRLAALCADPTLLTVGGSTVGLWGRKRTEAEA